MPAVWTTPLKESHCFTAAMDTSVSSGTKGGTRPLNEDCSFSICRHYCISCLWKSWGVQEAENNQLAVSPLEFISLMLFSRPPDWLRSILKRWQSYLFRNQLPCPFFPSTYFFFVQRLLTCRYLYMEMMDRMVRPESFPFSTSPCLLTTEMYNFWGMSKTWKVRTYIHHPLLSFKKNLLIFAISWQVYTWLLYLNVPSLTDCWYKCG